MRATTTTYSGTAGLLQIIQADAEHASVGSCASHIDPDLWHRDDQSDPDYCAGCTAAAVEICQTCPIRSWCAERSDGETVGVWAGTARSVSTDGRRGTADHTCPAGRRQRAAAWKRDQRARHRVMQLGDIPQKG